MIKIILSITLLNAVLIANDKFIGCKKTALGLYDEIVSCNHGDYHIKYILTNIKSIDDSKDATEIEYKKVIKVTNLSKNNSR